MPVCLTLCCRDVVLISCTWLADAVISNGGASRSTKHHASGGATASWGEDFSFELPSLSSADQSSEVLKLEVLDKRSWGADQQIGGANVSLSDIRLRGEMAGASFGSLPHHSHQHRAKQSEE
jgi:hypothetical protein